MNPNPDPVTYPNLIANPNPVANRNTIANSNPIANPNPGTHPKLITNPGPLKKADSIKIWILFLIPTRIRIQNLVTNRNPDSITSPIPLSKYISEF
jgi:hypothetical protein